MRSLRLTLADASWFSINQHSDANWNWVEVGDFVIASGYFTKLQTSQSTSYIVSLPKPIYAATVTANGWVSGDTSADVKYTSGDSTTQASFYLFSSRTGVNGGIYVHVMGRLKP